MIVSKPHITGSYHRRSWGGIQYDTPLFSEWTVGWTEDAGCGHGSCGEDWMDKQFVTWEDALAFSLSLDYAPEA